MTDLQERIARSLYSADGIGNPAHSTPWEMQPEKVRAGYLSQAREAMKKHTAADDVWRAVVEGARI